MSTIKAENAPHAAAIVTTTTSATSATPFSTNINSSAAASFQLSGNMSSTAASTTSSSTTMRHNNISVTNIKCEADDLRMCTSTTTTTTTTPLNGNLVPVISSGGGGGVSGGSYFNGHHATSGVSLIGGIRIPVPKAEDSDSEAELTHIENLNVTRRTSVSASNTNSTAITTLTQNKNGPRPMSWEGELSEPETTPHEADLMETENSLSNDRPYGSVNGGGLTVIKREATTTTPTPTLSIKPQLQQIAVELLNATPYLGAKHKQLTPQQQQHHLQQQQQQQHFQHQLPQSDPINLKYEPLTETSGVSTTSSTLALNSPLLARQKSNNMLPANPSPDSAIHSVYTHSSPSQSPLTSRHAPYTPSLSRNNSDASHSSCYSYSSEFSPTHSPIQGRHPSVGTAASAYGSYNGSALHHAAVLYRPISIESGAINGNAVDTPHNLSGRRDDVQHDANSVGNAGAAGSDALPSPGISRQQLINSPCPICGDKISGFHYGIFSCESCKGFFKRTVQNRKNYVCVRGGPCPVSIATRKKCPACRFEKCLQKGMKLEAIREDRTRGGRSTYQCSYTLPNSMLGPLLSPEQSGGGGALQQHHQQQQQLHQQQQQQRTAASLAGGVGNHSGYVTIKTEHGEHAALNGVGVHGSARPGGSIPVLLQEIMDVEHLWQYNEAELARLNQPLSTSSSSSSSSGAHTGSNHSSSSASSNSAANQIATNPLLASAGLSSNGENANPDLIAHLCNVADHRLYKIVKWCKSLPLFKNISIDDQICLLINSWCELLLFSCCYRSVETPGEIKMSQGKKITLAQAKTSGLQACIERMLNLTDHLRRLRVDRYEYVAMKVIVLLQSDTSELQEPVKVRECQEKALQSLQAYTLAHYPDTPSKFGELLLRIPDLQRTCQLGKEMLTIKSRDGGDFNLLMELLRGEH